VTKRTSGPAIIAASLCSLVILAALPFYANTTITYLFVDFFIMAIFAASYNVVFGMTGLLSFCHATFYGAGAYAVAMSASLLGTPVIVGLVLAPILAGILALMIGWIAVRTTGIQFAMLTLALGQLVYTVVVHQYNFTGGEDGLPIALPPWLTSAVALYYLALCVGAVCLWGLWRVLNSPFGAALAAIRQNSQRARFIGINVQAYQRAAFVIAGVVAGVAGGLRGIEQQAAYPTLFAWTQSAEPLLMTLAGGLTTFFGPVIGAALFVVLNFFVTKGFEYPLLVFGLVILAIVLVLPGGVASLFSRLRAAAGPSRS
jgi:branched-chain amino acid transport system permease protein